MILPVSITSIFPDAFWKCKRLQLINLKSISDIGTGAFGYCGSLETVYVSAKLDDVCHKAFLDCKHLLYFGPRGNTNGVANEGDEVIPQDIVIGREIISWKEDMIFDQGAKWRLKRGKFFMPNGVSLHTNCFLNCNAIGEISIPGNLEFFDGYNDKYFTYYSSVLNAVEIRPFRGNIRYELIFEFLYDIVTKIPKMATKPCTPEQLYPFDVALKYLVKHGYGVRNMTLHYGNSRKDGMHIIRVIFLFLRHNPSLICNYI